MTASLDLLTLRIGHGFDVHAFEDSGTLVLGGIKIPYSRGLRGHSDADVVLHVLIDALLGATSKGDIGSWFPDTDPAFKGADSGELLTKVWSSLLDEGWRLINCDVVIMAQEPKLRSHIDAMRESIRTLFSSGEQEIESNQVGVKATTTEKLGFIGRTEGIAASAVVLLRKES